MSKRIIHDTKCKLVLISRSKHFQHSLECWNVVEYKQDKIWHGTI